MIERLIWKWHRNYLGANKIVETLENLKMKYPNYFFNIKIYNHDRHHHQH